MRRFRQAILWPWACAVVAMVCLIWGNSLVPGEGSGQLSLTVMYAIQNFLASFGLPYEWLTNFLVRKAAHFSEYAVLGILASNALGPALTKDNRAFFILALFLVFVPSVDETIQLFVNERSGQVADVVLDCCGAAAGVSLRMLFSKSRQ